MERIAVLDSGGQYCHLIARKIRELGVYAEILPIDVDPEELRPYKGVILSGGPSSVYAPGRRHYFRAKASGLSPGHTEENAPPGLEVRSLVQGKG